MTNVVLLREMKRPERKRRGKLLAQRYPNLAVKLVERGMTLDQLAKKIKVKRPSLSRALNNRAKHSEIIPAVCSELGLSPAELFSKRTMPKQDLPMAA
jgi:lambda repressor-like predicted transcriptional regulator